MQSLYSFSGSMILLLATAPIALTVFAQETTQQGKGQTTLSLLVHPEAKLTVEPIADPASISSATSAEWFRVNLTIRINSETTTGLYVESIGTSAGLEGKVPDLAVFLKSPNDTIPKMLDKVTSQPLFLVPKNGKYTLLLGIKSNDTFRDHGYSVETIRFVLRSSDGKIHESATVSLKNEK